MFQLIVAVISIALVAALAIASIFYGGDAFTRSSEKANVTTLVNQGQQIAGAAALYKTDNGAIADGVVNSASLLVTDGYLSAAPLGNKLTTGSWTITTVGTAPNQTRQAEILFDAPSDGGASICAEVAKQGAGECLGTGPATYTGFAFAL